MWFSIVGPTAVGKTEFALWTAEQLLAQSKTKVVDIISADSRQVYQGLEIVSGVDIPPGFSQTEIDGSPVWVNDNATIRLWGLQMIRPNQEWSVAHFQDFIRPILAKAETEKRLAIVVGGTGLYQQQITQTDPKLHIGPNTEVREAAETMELAELQAWLQRVDYSKWEKMNSSDQSNPRRLIRALEIGLALLDAAPVAKPVPTQPLPLPSLMVGLTDEFESIEERIRARVLKRLEAGAVSEVERLQASYPDMHLPIYSATGVKILLALVSGEVEQTEALDKWAVQERQYAKRQLTWFKKQSTIRWFSIAESNWRTKALEVITTWSPE